MRTIIARERDKRIVDIFQSKPDIEFTFLPIFRYEELSMPIKWLDNLKSGYFHWIIFTSFRSWQILIKKISADSGYIPDNTKIAVFGHASVERIKQAKGRVDFTAYAHNAAEFGFKFINELKPKQNNLLDENKSMLEALLGIKRAGADIIITYFADNAAKLINK